MKICVAMEELVDLAPFRFRVVRGKPRPDIFYPLVNGLSETRAQNHENVVLERKEEPERVDDRPVYGPGPLRTAESEDERPLPRVGERQFFSGSLGVFFYYRFPERVACHDPVLPEKDEAFGECDHHLSREPPGEEVEFSRGDVLFVEVYPAL